ncbi:XRE family transcriptional regulator [Rhodococcus sp. NBC_00297]|uniref:XRE family transcriptional regulator n=1 Tax=Rhodococcus sp. NBC_00297 TaxID=2976005 RepID=UPI002E29B56B|nr:XRE family transcriptional regulator [Rhodococcus sp. NBC_00297]
MDGYGRLAEYAWKRRTQLGLSRPQVRERGGPSVPTLKDIEEGSGRTVSAGTLGKLDTGLEWQPGSAADVLRGGEPRSKSSTDVDAVLGPDTVVVSVRVVLDLLSISRELDAMARDRQDLAGLSALSRRMGVALRPIYGEYVTRLFEENRRRNGSLSPIYAMFGQLLDEPSESTDEVEREERLYRRWLAGRDVDVPAETVARFEARLHKGQK